MSYIPGLPDWLQRLISSGYPAAGIAPQAVPGTPSQAFLGGTTAMNNGLPRLSGPVVPGTGLSGLPGKLGFWPNLLYASLYSTPLNKGEDEVLKRFIPPTNTTPGTMQWPDSTSFPSGLPQLQQPTYRPEASPSFTAPNPYGAGMPRGTTLAEPPTTPAAAPAAAPAATSAPNSKTPKAPSNINLGYYTGSMGGPMGSAAGGARNPQYVPYIDPKDPRLYQGT